MKVLTSPRFQASTCESSTARIAFSPRAGEGRAQRLPVTISNPSDESTALENLLIGPPLAMSTIDSRLSTPNYLPFAISLLPFEIPLLLPDNASTLHHDFDVLEHRN